MRPWAVTNTLKCIDNWNFKQIEIFSWHKHQSLIHEFFCFPTRISDHKDYDFNHLFYQTKHILISYLNRIKHLGPLHKLYCDINVLQMTKLHNILMLLFLWMKLNNHEKNIYYLLIFSAHVMFVVHNILKPQANYILVVKIGYVECWWIYWFIIK